jgi:hypothetical protein
MSRVIVHRSEWFHSSQSKNKTQAEDFLDHFCDHNKPVNRSPLAKRRRYQMSSLLTDGLV